VSAENRITVRVVSIDRRWRDALRASALVECGGREFRLAAGDSLTVSWTGTPADVRRKARE
jgi:hypothetical protein